MERLFEISDNHGDRLAFGTFEGNNSRLHFWVTETVVHGDHEEQSQEVILDLDQSEAYAKAILGEVARLRGGL